MKQEFPSGANIKASGQILQQLLMKPRRSAKPIVEPKEDRETPKIKKENRREQLEAQWASLTEEQKSQVEKVVSSRLGKKSNSVGYRLMSLYEGNRLFFES